MMKLCFVTPDLFYEKMNKVASTEFPHIATEYLFYQTYTQVPGLIGARQQEFDAIIFSGQAPLEYAAGAIRQETYWGHIPRAGSTMLRAMLEASLRGWDITRLSVDTYSQALIEEVYAELGIGRDKLVLQVFLGHPTDADYNRSALEFHRRNLRRPDISGCITALYWVEQRMSEQGLPHVMAFPTYNVIRDQLKAAEQIYRAKSNSKGRIVVLCVNIGFPPDHSVVVQSEYQFMLEKSHIAQQIYRYAEQIQASVAEQSDREYLLFSTGDLIELETHYYHSMSLLGDLSQCTVYPVSVGIGHGDTVAEARSSAMAAMLRAQKHPRNAAYAMLADKTVIGPLFDSGKAQPEQKLDDKLLRVAERSGVSVNTAWRLYSYLLESERRHFTSSELAEGLRLSKRSADRLLEKLEQAGYAGVESKRMLSSSGRPARVMWVDLNR